MLAKDLIAELQKLPPDTIVVMSGDAEGNHYSPLAGCGMGLYVAENTWAGQYYDREEYESEIKEGYVDEGTGVPAFCVWPVN